MSLLAFFALRVLTRCTIARALEVHIALPSRPAATKDEFLTVMRKIDNWLHFRFRIVDCGKIGIRIVRLCIWSLVLDIWRFEFSTSCFNPRSAIRILQLVDDRSNRHFYDFRRRGTPVHFLPLPMSAVLRFDDWLVKKIGKIIDMLIGHQTYVASA